MDYLGFLEVSFLRSSVHRSELTRRSVLEELAPPFRSLFEGRVFEIGPLVDR